jgi:hypothetical protein
VEGSTSFAGIGDSLLSRSLDVVARSVVEAVVAGTAAGTAEAEAAEAAGGGVEAVVDGDDAVAALRITQRRDQDL